MLKLDEFDIYFIMNRWHGQMRRCLREAVRSGAKAEDFERLYASIPPPDDGVQLSPEDREEAIQWFREQIQEEQREDTVGLGDGLNDWRRDPWGFPRLYPWFSSEQKGS